MSWRYQVDFDRDEFNVIKDGGGNDNLAAPTYEYSPFPSSDVYVDDSTGVWILKVRVGIPTDLLMLGPTFYLEQLLTHHGGSGDDAQEAFELTTMQLGDGHVTVIARDVTECGTGTVNNGKYNYYAEVRFPTPPEYAPWLRKCDGPLEDPEHHVVESLVLNDFGAESEELVKYFCLRLFTLTGEAYPE